MCPLVPIVISETLTILKRPRILKQMNLSKWPVVSKLTNTFWVGHVVFSFANGCEHREVLDRERGREVQGNSQLYHVSWKLSSFGSFCVEFCWSWLVALVSQRASKNYLSTILWRPLLNSRTHETWPNRGQQALKPWHIRLLLISPKMLWNSGTRARAAHRRSQSVTVGPMTAKLRFCYWNRLKPPI